MSPVAGFLMSLDKVATPFGAVAVRLPRFLCHVVALIRRALDTMGRTGDTELTAFTDGCSGLRSILADAGVTSPPILDWFRAT